MSPRHAPTVDELLGDSLIQAVMRADEVDPRALRTLLTNAASRVALNRREAKPAATVFAAPRIEWRPTAGRDDAPPLPLPEPIADACGAALCCWFRVEVPAPMVSFSFGDRSTPRRSPRSWRAPARFAASCAGLAVPRDHAAADRRQRQLSRRGRAGGVDTATTSLAEQVNGVEGTTYMSSSTSNDSASTITVTFNVGYPLDIAAVEVQNHVSQAASWLPAIVTQGGVTIKKQNSDFVLIVSLISPDHSVNPVVLSNSAYLQVVGQLKRPPVVSDMQKIAPRSPVQPLPPQAGQPKP